ncbi:hypothetical protein RB195_016778 [Necator americanus]|uniref:Uncharacterized protein n=1 Tax=Necator americanus TaxID=51031 RepID=A0ABR1C241_NECAM
MHVQVRTQTRTFRTCNISVVRDQPGDSKCVRKLLCFKMLRTRKEHGVYRVGTSNENASKNNGNSEIQCGWSGSLVENVNRLLKKKSKISETIFTHFNIVETKDFINDVLGFTSNKSDELVCPNRDEADELNQIYGPFIDLKYADAVIFALSTAKLQRVDDLVSKSAAAYGSRSCPDKYKQMWVSAAPSTGIRVNEQPVELENELCYLDCILKNDDSCKRGASSSEQDLLKEFMELHKNAPASFKWYLRFHHVTGDHIDESEAANFEALFEAFKRAQNDDVFMRMKQQNAFPLDFPESLTCG